jgi:hypothetical protein
MENLPHERYMFGDREALLQTFADCLVLKNTGRIVSLSASS